ncbi:hypothetical protein B0A48_08505 [Cryoendolithus antarcticus]|uniref:Uncharacterized protein n=1 Tax=Cryoendolithus antarcticus TaxID=1507870 RepID=A0A1V8T652_9PEZI|nr:hypothetical protein B0A48_08505 [Cryoendolithus antarcticus]OQO24759.1 hypothetical protein B0A51_07784 [Rachicladosporium sp. CCFEE 5018]OQO25102.1 hypothetical protein B0A51_07424 [Rachicladosporium sp. CCFEE 5018]
MPPPLQSHPLSTSPPTTLGAISLRTASLSSLTASHVTIAPGGSWSRDLKPKQGTDSCQKGHVGYILKGELGIKMDDGTEEGLKEGDVFVVPPGHDAWCVGSEECVFVEFGRGAEDVFGK